ncbi:hypothetical protein TNCV_2058871 [Trichonephila clavipes]|nr:hypothetical protein TNCV_2058871 [Trichonephila clavipes]
MVDSWLACHKFEPGAAKDPPCRGDRCMLNMSRLKRPPIDELQAGWRSWVCRWPTAPKVLVELQAGWRSWVCRWPTAPKVLGSTPAQVGGFS